MKNKPSKEISFDSRLKRNSFLSEYLVDDPKVKDIKTWKDTVTSTWMVSYKIVE